MPEIDEKTMVAYLLGDMSEEEQALAAMQFFTEPHYQQLQIVEEELIEDYVRGELSPAEAERFEKFFLAAPHRRERVEFARAMLAALTEKKVAVAEHESAEPSSPSWWQSLLFFLRSNISITQASLVAASFVMLIGCVWLIYENRRLRNETRNWSVQQEAERVARQQHEQQLQQQLTEQQARNEQLTEELERQRRAQSEPSSAQPSPSTIFAFTLNSLLVKGDEASKIVIPTGKQQLRIRLELEHKEIYRSYRAVLRKAEEQGFRQIAARRATPTASGRAVVASLPAGLFITGDYILTLKGVTASGTLEDIADYQFNIVKK